MKQYLVWCLVNILILLGLIGCTRNEQGLSSSSDTLRIGLIVNTLGAYANTSGQPTLMSAQLAVQEVNAEGGVLVNGRYFPVELVVEEIEGNVPETAVAAAYRLITQEDVDVIIGPQFSTDAIAVAQAAQEAHIPMISPMATNPVVTANNAYAFRVGFIDSFQGEVMAQFVYDDLDIRETAILFDVANDYSNGIAGTFKTAYEALGGTIVAYETYTSDDNTDFQAQLTRIADSGAQALLLPNYAQQLYIQARQASEMGLDVTLIGTDSWGGLDVNGRSEFDDSYYGHHWHETSDNPVSQQFVAYYRQTYSTEEPIMVSSALTYDAIKLLVTAVAQQKTITPATIREELANLQHFNGVSGMISYQGTGDPIKSAVIMHIKDNTKNFYKIIQPNPQ